MKSNENYAALGFSLPTGVPVPRADITVSLPTAVTSRVFGDGLSEALLLIDEPGASGTGGATGPGTTLPQTLCSGGALGAGPGGCETYLNSTATYSRASKCLTFTGGLCTSFGETPNVFQGVVNSNQVVFTGVPVLAPVTSGYARVFQITNVRVNAAQFAPIAVQGATAILATVTIAAPVTLVNPVQTTAFLFDALQPTAVRNATNTADGSGISLQQCATTSLQPGAVLRFPERTAASFKTRVAPAGSLSGAGTPLNSVVTVSSFSQNVPGFIYAGSESNLLFPVTGGTAGLADFGTRLKATFLNVPAGVEIYVSTTNINPLGNTGVNPSSGTDLTFLDAAVASGNLSASAAIKMLAGLVTSETAVAAPGSALPLRAATNTASNVRLFGPLPVAGNGTATAVWELLLADPTHLESAEFAVFYRQTGAPPLAPAGTVALSLGPTYTSYGNGTLIPGWTPPSAATNLVTVSACPAVTVSATSSANPSSYGQALVLTATVTGASGTVTFRDGATALGTVTISGGKAILTTAALATGSHAITATVNTDPAVTSSPLTQVVNKASTATSVNAAGGSANATQGVMFSATVTSSGGVPSGMVTFRDGATVLGTALLDSTGTARLFGVALPIGSHSITATYPGDGNFTGSASGAQGFSVNALSSSVSTPVLRSGTPAPGASLTFAATVSGDGPPLTGMVTFQDGGRTLGASPMDGSGTATVTATLGAGTHSITASYSGDVMRSGSTSGALVLTIQAAPTVTLTSSANPAEVGAAITLTASVTGAAGSPIPTGTVTFHEGSVTLGSGALDGSGKAVLTTASGLTAGEHSITAAYGGDGNYEAATSAALALRVARSASTTALLASSRNGSWGLTAVVTGAVGTAPSGTVRFQDVTAGQTLGMATLANGMASLALTGALPVGHMLQAVYEGDTRFEGSSSATQQIVGATNGFSFTTELVPDGMASIFGAGLTGEPASATGMPLPATLGGVTVRIVDASGKSYAAGLYYVSAGQVNFVVPADVPLGPARLEIATAGGTWTVDVTVTRSGPALASANGSGSGAAAAHVIRLHRDGTQEAPAAVSTGAIAWGTDGDRLFLVLYGTGLRHAASPVSCSLNGAPAATLYAGAHGTYPGLDQVNLEIPAGLRGTVAVRCSADGTMSNAVTVMLQ
jgi:uncharacterized protein (TIGR03437 family)